VQPTGLAASIQPDPAPLDTPTTFIVSATDLASGASVTGEVLLDGEAVGATNTPLQLTLRREQRRRFDPETRRWFTEVVDPSLTVRASGYPEAVVDLGL
jgi:hypothetical protein